MNRVHEVRVTARPAVGPLTRGNSWDDHRTSPIMPRALEGPRSRSGAFHSLPTPVRYGGPRTGAIVRADTRRADIAPVTVRPIGTAPSAAARGERLRRGWPGRGHSLAS